MSWLKANEIASELHISRALLRELRKRGKLTFINLNPGGNPDYRYKLPAPDHFAPVVKPIERVAMLTYDEVADVLGINRISVRAAVHYKQLAAVRIGKRNYVTVLELRRYIVKREKFTGQAKRGVSKIIVRWVKEYLERNETPVQVLESLLEEARKRLPEGMRSQAISDLWAHFEAVDKILKMIESRGLEEDGPGGEIRTPVG